MINPYESNNVFNNDTEGIVGDQITISMIQSLRNVIQQTLSYFDALTGYAIVFFKVPLPINPNDPVDPIDQITYEFILNFILFNGGNYTFENPKRFHSFFENLDWKDITNHPTPRSSTHSFWNIFNNAWNYVKRLISSLVVNFFPNYFLNSTESPVMSMPLCIFNFFMNLPFVLFNFDAVKNGNPKPVGTLSTSVAVLSEHFVPIFTGSFTSLEIKQLMNQYYSNNPVIFKAHMGRMLKFLYSIIYKNPTVISEARAESYFKEVLEPMCVFIGSTSGRDLTVIGQQPIIVNVTDFMGPIPNEHTRRIKPDLVIYEGNQARIVIEMKAPPLFKCFKIPQFYEMITSLSESIEEEDSSSESGGKRLHKLLRQLLVYMIGLKCSRGMISDGYSVILVEIDTLKLKQPDKENQVNEIPLKLTTFDCKSSYPSYLQGILYFLMKEVLEPITFNDKSLHFKAALRSKETVVKENFIGIGDLTTFAESKDQSVINLPSSPLIISWEDKPEILQSVLDCLSHVVKIKAKFIKSYILEDIDDDEDIVVKIFDPNLTRIEKSDRYETTKIIENFYEREKKAAETLNSMQVDTLYLKQIYGTAIYNYGYGPLIKGKFIISRYFKSDKLPITYEGFTMAREQLSKVHEAGIVHGDIREPNILFNKEYNKVYFIDFGKAIAKDVNERDIYSNYFIRDFNVEQADDVIHLSRIFRVKWSNYNR